MFHQRRILALVLLVAFIAPQGVSNAALELPPGVEKAIGSVVEIKATSVDRSEGAIRIVRTTGFILKLDGSIVTAAHLFWKDDSATGALENFNSIFVIPLMATTVFQAVSKSNFSECTPSNPLLDNQNDLAIIKIESKLQLLGGLKLGEASVNQDVWILGFGQEDRFTPTAGRVTSIDSKLRIEAAAVFPGMSGSPVVDNAGHVVGIVVQRIEGRPIALASPAQAIEHLHSQFSCL